MNNISEKYCRIISQGKIKFPNNQYWNNSGAVVTTTYVCVELSCELGFSILCSSDIFLKLNDENNAEILISPGGLRYIANSTSKIYVRSAIDRIDVDVKIWSNIDLTDQLICDRLQQLIDVVEDIDIPTTIEVSNFPASIQVSNFPASVQVSNFPAFPVSIQVSNFPASVQVSNFPASVQVSNFPASVQVSNFPAFPVSIQVSNFPASVQISNFPAFPVSIQVSNFPASVQVSNFPSFALDNTLTNSNSILTNIYNAILGLGVGMRYVNRGGPATFDKTFAAFTFNWAWHDLDLSAFCPVESASHLIHLRLQLIATDTSSLVQFRTKGSVGDINIVELNSDVAGEEKDSDCFIECDANRKIEYKGSTPNISALNLSVRGWWRS